MIEQKSEKIYPRFPKTDSGELITSNLQRGTQKIYQRHHWITNHNQSNYSQDMYEPEYDQQQQLQTYLPISSSMPTSMHQCRSKLQRRVSDLINQRKIIESRISSASKPNSKILQKVDLTACKGQFQVQQSNNPQSSSRLSGQSDIDKQVNFLCPLQEESQLQPEVPSNKHNSFKTTSLVIISQVTSKPQSKSEYEFGIAYPQLANYHLSVLPSEQGFQALMKRVEQPSNKTAFGQLLRILGSNYKYLASLFPEPEQQAEQNYVNVRVFASKRQKILKIGHKFKADPIQPPIIDEASNSVYIYPIVLEKAVSYLVGGPDQVRNCSLNLLVQFFQPFITQVHLLSSSLSIQSLLEDDPNALYFVKDANNQSNRYLKLQKMGQGLQLAFSVENHTQPFSFAYLKFIFKLLCVIHTTPKPLTTVLSQRIVHNMNHFAVLTIKLEAEAILLIEPINVQSSSTLLILCKPGAEQIQQILQFNSKTKQELSLSSLPKGIYELYISNTHGNTEIRVSSSTDRVRLDIRHKQEYRHYTQRIIKAYLAKSKFKLNYYEQALCTASRSSSLEDINQCMLVRCQLFIGLWADMVVNLSDKTWRIVATYDGECMADTYYKCAQRVFRVQAGSYHLIPLRWLGEVSTSPPLAQISIRL